MFNFFCLPYAPCGTRLSSRSLKTQIFKGPEGRFLSLVPNSSNTRPTWEKFFGKKKIHVCTNQSSAACESKSGDSNLWNKSGQTKTLLDHFYYQLVCRSFSLFIGISYLLITCQELMKMFYIFSILQWHLHTNSPK